MRPTQAQMYDALAFTLVARVAQRGQFAYEELEELRRELLRRMVAGEPLPGDPPAERPGPALPRWAAGSRVYFVQAGEGGPIKIGVSGDVKTRMASLQGAHFERLRLLGSTPGTSEDERKLHQRFSAARVKGEWFRPVPALLLYIGMASPSPSPSQPPYQPPTSCGEASSTCSAQPLACRGAP